MTNELKGTALAHVAPGAVQVADIQNVRALAKDLLDSGLFQGVKNIAGAVTVIQAGLELGIPPVAALNTMVIISGRLAMEAKLLLAVAHAKAGVTWKVIKEDDKGCEILFSRPGWEDQTSSFTEAEAKTANLLGKTNWTLWKKDMYFARAAGRGVRRIAPDALLGMYAKEELLDSEGVDINGDAKVAAPPSEKMLKLSELKADCEASKGKPLPDVADEFSGGEGESFGEQVGAEVAEDHDKTKKKPAPEPEDPDGPGLAALEKFAKVKAGLVQEGVGEEAMWTGITKFTADTLKMAVTDVNDYTTEQLLMVVGYLNRRLHATQADKAKKAKANG